MMKKCSASLLKKLWIIRRRDDRVKIIIYGCILTIAFFIAMISNVYKLYGHINNSAEYELKGDLKSKAKLNELSMLDDVNMISLQRESTVLIKCNTKESYIQCVFLSKQYAKQIYGIEKSNQMPAFYLNKAAYEQLKNALDIQLNNNHEEEFLIEYMSQDGEYKSAKVILVSEKVSEEGPFAFAVDNSSSLAADADKVRVYAEKQDLEQTTIKKCETLGYFVANKEDMIKFENQLNILFLKIKYELLICLLCVIWIRYYCKHVRISDTIKPITEK